ncbi:hypothetical protein AB0J63_28150 [Streptosporangium canum]|uniref:hypothetical protein n=1 Tax=Streptosporangium canum TaxID=324952 RepID=UPI0034261807
MIRRLLITSACVGIAILAPAAAASASTSSAKAADCCGVGVVSAPVLVPTGGVYSSCTNAYVAASPCAGAYAYGGGVYGGGVYGGGVYGGGVYGGGIRPGVYGGSGNVISNGSGVGHGVGIGGLVGIGGIGVDIL